MSETSTSDTNATELEHDDGRGDPAREASAGASPDAPANPSASPTSLYDVDGRGYGCLYAPDQVVASADRTVQPKGFICDDPGSLCDDPNSLLAE